MKRRSFLLRAAVLLAAVRWPSMLEAATEGNGKIRKIIKSDAEWRALLEPKRYKILRKEGTEPRFSSPLNDEKREGVYACAGCELPLFTSKMKYDSKTGWPSFFQSIPGRIETKLDFLHIIPRTEYHCARCEGHQGHVFDQEISPSGRRYCNNGLALHFKPGKLKTG